MAATKVNCLKIAAFRRFKDIEIPFGSNVTLITGQNGTSKSTLLGMLAQPFSFGVVRGATAGSADNSSYTSNYHGLVLRDHVDFTGRHFMYDCDDVFRLSKQYDSNNNTYQYETVLDDIVSSPNSPLVENTLFTRNRGRSTAKGVRFVTGPGPSHKLGEGNFPHPVIYLGLNRLWPLAETKKCTFTGDALSKKDNDWYVQKYNEILCLDEHGNGAKFMDTPEKRKFVTPESTDYDGESCSAGQDNLGQLLTAILSFRSLKKDLGTKYRGGMLLIDELDATLHAFAQDKLLELLCEVSEELGLQVIATTHSLWLLKKAFKSRLRQSTEVIGLSNSDGAISLEGFTSFESISDHLKVEATPPPTRGPKKVLVVFEDREGQDLFWQICGSKLRNYISAGNTATFGAGDLKNLGVLTTNLPVLQGVILVPDGDMAKTWTNPPRNLLALPGDKRPETLAYRHLFLMSSADPFWGNPSASYTRQFAIISKGGMSQQIGDDKDWVKAWYREQSRHWGRSNARVFRSWVASHKQECLSFCKKFLKLLKARYKGDIPKDVIDRALAPLRETE